MKPVIPFIALASLLHAGVPVDYTLPSDPGKTYLVTLAITDPADPDWIVSTFTCGEPRTVTAENGGKFTEIWDGLDENFMPVPPGRYAVKGIFSPAEKWRIDGEFHAIVPVFNGGASSWLPPRDRDDLPVPFGGDPVNAPLADVDVGANGVAVFYYRYLENGTNLPMFDLNQPAGYGQFLRAFNSGGAGGGPCAATDGEKVWAYCAEGGPRYLYRADQNDFGQSPDANRRNGRFTDGYVTALAAGKDPATGKPFLYAAQRGKHEFTLDHLKRRKFHESATDFVNQVTVHDGESGDVLATIPLERPQGLALSAGMLHALHRSGDSFVVSALSLEAGLPSGKWKPLFTVPEPIVPEDLEVDAKGRIYLSDGPANKVHQFDGSGKIIRSFGRLPVQKPGSYDKDSLMNPGKLAVWRDKQGLDRLLVVERSGPNRVSEWNCENGTLIRGFTSHQTKCNNGYAIDPEDASLVYLPGHDGWLTRFKVDYTSGEWKVDAVWPDVPSEMRGGISKPIAVRANGRVFLASTKSLAVFRLADDSSRWIHSAGVIRREKSTFLWNDANGNGGVDDEELRPSALPGTVITYHGQRWLGDLSYISPDQGGTGVWRLAPESFDAHGNPVFTGWTKVLEDPVFEARAKGPVNAIRGGNELAVKFESDWMQADGSPADGYFVQARAHNFSANEAGQHKITRYVPDGKGGYRMKWRVGRSVLGSPARGEIKGGMRIFKPINGLLSVIDQSRSGVFLYTDDGLYVDTLFPPDGLKQSAGTYLQPGEFFAGTIYPDPSDGTIYYGSGKYTPLVYSMKNWSLRENPVRRLTHLPASVTITAGQIASPPGRAVAIRGGAGKARFARFAPAAGGVMLDGSMTGWESADAITFSGSDDQTVEVRGTYDPDHLYLRWHVRTGTTVATKPLPPLERLFTHDVGADTVGFYFQGDDSASNAPKDGRPGDVRFVLGLFDDHGKTVPAAMAMHPSWNGANPRPQTYRTPVGEVSFAHVGAVDGIGMGHSIDADGKGFVIAAAIPRSEIPAAARPFGGGFKTLVNFDANLGGHRKFWWADSDGSASRETYDEPSEARFYPGSWAPVEFTGLDDGLTVRNWLTLGPFGGPGAEHFKSDPPGKMKDEVRAFYEQAIFPPDEALDFSGAYDGPLVKGYWKDPGKIRWKEVSTEPLDSRTIVGPGAQLWYGATWIHAPAESEVTFAFQGHPMTQLRWFLNGQPIHSGDKDYADMKTPARLREATLPVTLRPGWNLVHFRGYNYGYTPFRAGLVVRGGPDTLWKLRFTNQPPTGGR